MFYATSNAKTSCTRHSVYICLVYIQQVTKLWFSLILLCIPSITAKAMIFDWLDEGGVRMVKLKGSRQLYKQMFISLSNIYLIFTK